MEQEFDRVAKLLKQHMHQFTDDQKLHMYGLYKQSKEGDIPDNYTCNDMYSNFKKKAWEKNKGMKQEDAMQTYINIAYKFEKLKNKKTA